MPPILMEHICLTHHFETSIFKGCIGLMPRSGLKDGYLPRAHQAGSLPLLRARQECLLRPQVPKSPGGNNSDRRQRNQSRSPGEKRLSQPRSPVGTFRRATPPLRISVRDFESSKSLDEFSCPLRATLGLVHLHKDPTMVAGTPFVVSVESPHGQGVSDRL